MVVQTDSSQNYFKLLFALISFVTLTQYEYAIALEPNEVLVVANKSSSKSVGLANYYINKRNVPEENLVLLWVTDKETSTREDYLKKIVAPIRRFLDSNTGKNIRCIVTIYGLPLKISPPDLDEKEQRELNRLNEKRDKLNKEIESSAAANKDIVAEYERVLRQLKDFDIRHDKWASLDSELSLVKKDRYDLSLWLANPFYLHYKNIEQMPVSKEDLIMVSRLDAPDVQTVKRIINDSIETEAIGLSGNGCFDARWKKPDAQKKVSGYALNDKMIHLAAEAVEQSTLIKKVIKDDDGKLFQAGACPDTALYCGWYSLAKYVNSFTWVKGSIGYHVASSECATLKAGSSEVWCKRMLEEGIAATIGPIGEPYVESFPNPAIFFSFLLDGYLSLVECYYVSLPFVSWKMVLVGDPLYQPFKAFRIKNNR